MRDPHHIGEDVILHQLSTKPTTRQAIFEERDMQVLKITQLIDFPSRFTPSIIIKYVLDSVTGCTAAYSQSDIDPYRPDATEALWWEVGKQVARFLRSFDSKD